ncbi:FGGY family carbohydrate kinase [uncultured Polaribacter sp.]|uniref:FGGY family carbohydrate kinase n=1 Tax=uncultured Polaribacter sp. TaxID=174711 RepID=UPI00262C95A2|nr:FGGY family carbohydrate kinase [uncultured Polaribacter sp.]
MKNVIAIVDIGKTNKKIFLFDQKFDIVSMKSVQFKEIKDEDGFPCDDIASIENWILAEIRDIQTKGIYKIKAINFSTHGASIIFLDKNGKRLTPLYNYLKPLDLSKYTYVYEANGGIDEFSRKTASPAYGMLNTGIQILKLKNEKPEIWKNVVSILHYPQYLSYLFTKEITAEFTSIGAHTATWDFDNMQYHSWLKDESITLPEPSKGKEAILTEINGENIAVGTGLHDSSSSIIPILEKEKGKNYVLLSTGTWIIAMNPFSKKNLTKKQLKNNCLCFMTPEKQQVKSSMQFLGKIHEVYTKALTAYFKTKKNAHKSLYLDIKLCETLISRGSQIFLEEGIDTNFEANLELPKKFTSFEKAYYQLVYEICKKVITGIDLILDDKNKLTDIFISGGFNSNEVFTKFLSLMKKNVRIRLTNSANESAYGAALMMRSFLKD